MTEPARPSPDAGAPSPSEHRRPAAEVEGARSTMAGGASRRPGAAHPIDDPAALGIVEVTEALGGALERHSAAEALALLNARTRFRFTGVYRPEPPLLRNVCLFDRENATVNVSGACSPLDRTFCVLVWGSARPFYVSDAAADPQLGPHSADGSVLSYAGVPIRAATGEVIGTLCHFDARPRILPPAELLVMEAAASLFGPWLEHFPVESSGPGSAADAGAAASVRRSQGQQELL